MLCFGSTKDESGCRGLSHAEIASAVRSARLKAIAAAIDAANFIEGRSELKNGAMQQQTKKVKTHRSNELRARPEGRGSQTECPRSEGIMYKPEAPTKLPEKSNQGINRFIDGF